jgi:hypothetical protein
VGAAPCLPESYSQALCCSSGQVRDFYRKSMAPVCKYDVELSKTDDPSIGILHEDRIVIGLFADFFALGIIQPDSQRFGERVVVDSHFFYIRSLALLCPLDRL